MILKQYMMVMLLLGGTPTSSTPQPASMCLDTTVADLSLLNRNTQTNLLLTASKRERGNDGFDYLQFYNKATSEILILCLLPDSTLSLMGYTMYYAPSDHKFPTLQATSIPHFATGKGIRLGLSKQSVLKMLGKPSEVDSATNRFYYRLEGPNHPLLLRYNATKYLAKYRFRDSLLSEASVDLFLK